MDEMKIITDETWEQRYNSMHSYAEMATKRVAILSKENEALRIRNRELEIKLLEKEGDGF